MQFHPLFFDTFYKKQFIFVKTTNSLTHALTELVQ